MLLEDMVFLSEYITNELNVITLTVSSDRAKYGISVKPFIDGKIAGARLKVVLHTAIAIRSTVQGRSQSSDQAGRRVDPGATAAV